MSYSSHFFFNIDHLSCDAFMSQYSKLNIPVTKEFYIEITRASSVSSQFLLINRRKLSLSSLTWPINK